MNRLRIDLGTFDNGAVVYQPHRLEQSGCVLSFDGGVEYLHGVESVGDRPSMGFDDVKELDPVNILTV